MYYIKSPLNYTGNKYRLLPQIMPHFPQKVNRCVDLFCGGATVGFNLDAKERIFIDSNPYVISLLEYLAAQDFCALIKRLEKIIAAYGLTYSAEYGYSHFSGMLIVKNNNGLKELNKDGYYRLRADFNACSDKMCGHALDMLYILMVCGFNNDLRFNSSGGFNLPVGKTDFNRNNVNKLKEYILRANGADCRFICKSFEDDSVAEIILQSDLVYADPPYLITTAVYNENNGWNVNLENKLLSLYDRVLESATTLIFSNVLSRGEVVNMPLTGWLDKNSGKVEVIPLDYGYKSASYNKIIRLNKEQEILVKGNTKC